MRARYFTFLAVLAIIGCFIWSCGDDDKGPAAVLCISPDTLNISAAGGNSPFAGITNCGNNSSFAWQASEEEDWLSLTDSSGTTPDSFIVVADSNTSGASRTGIIVVEAIGVSGSPDTVTVVQPSTVSALCVSDTLWVAPAHRATSPWLKVLNCGNALSFSWEASESETWLSLSKTSGSTSDSFTIAVDSNKTDGDRTGIIVVTAEGIAGSPDTIKVVQSLIPAELCVSPPFWEAPAEGGTSSAVDVTNCGNDLPLSWSVSEAVAWLTLSKTSGTTPDSFTITATAPNLTGSARTGKIIVTVPGISGSPDTITVTQISVGAVLCVADTLWAAPAAGGTSSAINVTNCGNNVSFNWTAAENETWLSLSKTSGNTPGSFTITAQENRTGSPRSDTVTVTALGIDGSPRIITITQETLPATLCVDPTSWSASGTAGASPQIKVTNCGNDLPRSWTASEGETWLTLSKTSGTTPDSFTINASENRTGETRSGMVTVTSLIGTQTVTVTQTSIPAALCVSATSWNAPATGDVDTIQVTNCGNNASFTWTASESETWLSISPASGSTPGNLMITALENKTGATRSGTVTVSATGVSGSPKMITVTQTSISAALCVSDTVWAASSSGGTKTIDVTNCGNNEVLAWTAVKDSAWLTVSPGSGNTPGSLTITALENKTGSTRIGTVTVTATKAGGVSGSPKTIVVTQSSVPRMLCISSASWVAPPEGGTKTIQVTNCGGGASFTWTATKSDAWLSLLPGSGTTPGSFTITATENRTGSSRTGLVIVAATGINGSPDTITVTQAWVPDLLCISPSRWEAPAAGGTRSDVTVRNCGDSTGVLEWVVTLSAAWLTASPLTGSTPATLTITAAKNASGATRNATVIVRTDGLADTLVVAQSSVPGDLYVSDTVWLAPADGDTSGTINVTNVGNADTLTWTATEDSTWLSLSTGGGTTPSNFTIIALVNSSGLYRTGIVKVKAQEINDSALIRVTQASTVATLCLSAYTWTAPAVKDTSVYIRIENCGNATVYPWTATKDSSWLTLPKASGNTPDSLTVIVDSNRTGLTRIGKIIVTGSGGISGSPDTITVTQVSLPAALCISDSAWAALPAGGVDTINVTNCGNSTSIAWTAAVTVGAVWLSVSVPGGSTPGSFTMTAVANPPGGSARTGTVRVTAPDITGAPTKTISVTQAPQPPPRQ